MMVQRAVSAIAACCACGPSLKRGLRILSFIKSLQLRLQKRFEFRGYPGIRYFCSGAFAPLGFAARWWIIGRTPPWAAVTSRAGVPGDGKYGRCEPADFCGQRV